MNTYVPFDLKQHVSDKGITKTVSKTHVTSRVENNSFPGFMLKILKLFDAEGRGILHISIHKAVKLPSSLKALRMQVDKTVNVVKIGKQVPETRICCPCMICQILDFPFLSEETLG